MESNNQKKILQHNTFVFKNSQSQNGTQSDITFDSNFDSGNCFQVDRVATNHFIIWTAPDCAGQETQSHQQSWFYFQVTGISKQAVKFTIQQINMLWTVAKSPEIYRPVFRIGLLDWRRLETPASIALSFDFYFEYEHIPISFAFSYPWSYTECDEMLSRLEKTYSNEPEFYFHREVMTTSPGNRSIDLVTITSHEGQTKFLEDKVDEYLFPEMESNPRAIRFRNSQNVILLTARVHPGQTPASYSMNGILKFLTDKQDARAMILRKYFVFMLVPMLNPDGVYHGHYRMDILNQNLNRHYSAPNVAQQPACYAVQKLAEYLNRQDRLIFYCDLHAHAGQKGCFFYGNAIDDFVMQVQSQLYAQILSLNCINFEYDSCNFSQKQMNSKDRFEEFTQDGCGRVVIHQTCNLVHSYTLQCGFHCSNYLNQLPYQSSIHRKFGIYQCVQDDIENLKSDIYARGAPFYTPQIYENIGKTLLISILDVFQKNPYSRIINSQFKTVDLLRREMAFAISKLDRFQREQAKLMNKCQQISEYVNDQYYQDNRKINQPPNTNLDQQQQNRKLFQQKTENLNNINMIEPLIIKNSIQSPNFNSNGHLSASQRPHFLQNTQIPASSQPPPQNNSMNNSNNTSNPKNQVNSQTPQPMIYMNRILMQQPNTVFSQSFNGSLGPVKPNISGGGIINTNTDEFELSRKESAQKNTLENTNNNKSRRILISSFYQGQALNQSQNQSIKRELIIQREQEKEQTIDKSDNIKRGRDFTTHSKKNKFQLDPYLSIEQQLESKEGVTNFNKSMKFPEISNPFGQENIKIQESTQILPPYTGVPVMYDDSQQYSGAINKPPNENMVSANYNVKQIPQFYMGLQQFNNQTSANTANPNPNSLLIALQQR